MKINVDKEARKIEVDNKINLRNYYRIADNLLKQANIYRDEGNVVDLFITLLRFSSLITETIPHHRDYHVLCAKERGLHRKEVLTVLDELDSLKPEFDLQVKEMERAQGGHQLLVHDGKKRILHGLETSSQWPSVNKSQSSVIDHKQPTSLQPYLSWSNNFNNNPVSTSTTLQVEKQFQKLSFNLPRPKPETLSRHSILGPNGLQGQWKGPRTDKVQYPKKQEFDPESARPNQDVQSDLVASKDGNPREGSSMIESVLSLDDGRWLHPAEESFSSLITPVQEDSFQLVNIKQPSPPPILANVQQKLAPIPPSKVADPRPGLAKPSQDGPDSYQHLHVPVQMLEDFLRLARVNTQKNLETCGVLAGSLKNRVFHITTLIIPKQESTSDSCQTLNEEEIFEVQDRLSLFTLGWIHTHPSQTCFMSSVDLHTHYSYQTLDLKRKAKIYLTIDKKRKVPRRGSLSHSITISRSGYSLDVTIVKWMSAIRDRRHRTFYDIMLPEAIAIVMAPTDTSCPHGIFHLSDPGGVSVIRSCQQSGFHPHEEPSDGTPIYEHCSHVYMNSKLRFSVVDLR